MSACSGDCGACEPCHEEQHGACASSACPCCGRPKREAIRVNRRCGHCDNQAVPGLRHYADWPVCADHETPLCAAALTISQPAEPDRVMRCAKASTHDGRHHNGEWGSSWEATDGF